MQHVFISFKHDDLEFAENIISNLEREGFTTWADFNIRAGEEWRGAIDLAIKNAAALIVIMGPEAKSSEYVTYEWAFALGAGIRVIPIMLRPTQLHPRLEALQCLGFTNPKSRPWDRLLEEVKAAFNASPAHSVSIPVNSPPFIRQAAVSLDSVSIDVKRDAIETLRSAKTPDAYMILREALKHPISDVRMGAARALADVGDPAIVPVLIEELRKPGPGRYPMKEIDLLRGVGAHAVPALIEALEAPDSPGRAWVAHALGGIGDPVAVQALIEALRDPDPGVRAGAAQGLGGIGDPVAVQALIEALKDIDKYVRSGAAYALGRLNDPAVAPALTKMRRDPEQHVRNAVRQILKGISR